MVSIKWELSQTECFESTKSNHKQNIFPNKIQFDKGLVDADNNSHANFTKISCKNFSKKKLIFLKHNNIPHYFQNDLRTYVPLEKVMKRC